MQGFAFLIDPQLLSSVLHLYPPLGSLPNRGEKHNTLTSGVRREELRHLIIKKRQARRPQALPVRCQVDFAPNDGRFELGGAIAAIPEAL